MWEEEYIESESSKQIIKFRLIEELLISTTLWMDEYMNDYERVNEWMNDWMKEWLSVFDCIFVFYICFV